jgi:hypothetical protein
MNMKIKKIILIGLGLIFSLTVNSSESTTNDILVLKVGIHQITAGFYSYQGSNDHFSPSFDEDITKINELLAEVVSSENMSAVESEGMLSAWNGFKANLNQHLNRRNYTNAHTIKDMLEKKSLFLAELERYESLIESTPSEWKRFSYLQSITLTKIMEKYSKLAASPYELAASDLSELLSFYSEFDTNLDLLKEVIVSGSPDEARLIKKIMLKWNFIKPTIADFPKKQAAPFIVVRYGNDIINKLMSIEVNIIKISENNFETIVSEI